MTALRSKPIGKCTEAGGPTRMQLAYVKTAPTDPQKCCTIKQSFVLPGTESLTTPDLDGYNNNPKPDSTRP